MKERKPKKGKEDRKFHEGKGDKKERRGSGMEGGEGNKALNEALNEGWKGNEIEERK